MMMGSIKNFFGMKDNLGDIFGISLFHLFGNKREQ